MFNKYKLKQRKLNNKAEASSLVVWIIAFFFILFVMLIFLGFTLISYGDRKLNGENKEISLKERQISNLEKKEFLFFLNREINVNGKKEKVINAIKNSLDPFFEIKNEKGEDFIQSFGLKALETQEDSLYDKMLVRGFDEKDWDSLLVAMENIQNGKMVKEMIKTLNEICITDKWNSYLLELPYGIITKDGLKLSSAIGEEVFYESEDNELIYNPLIYFTFNYRGENIKLKFRKSLECEK